MSIDIEITQKAPQEKALPLSVIMGHEHGDKLLISEEGDGWFLVFDPDHVGRGISVDWVEGTTDMMSLRMNHATCPSEVRALFRIVERIAGFWDCVLDVDGAQMSPADFLATLDEVIETNEDVIRNVLPNVISEDGHTAQVMGALMTLHMDADDIAGFVADPASYYAWLHDRQTIDAKYVKPVFFKEEDGSIVGAYPVRRDTLSIVPLKASVPFGLKNAETDEPLKVDRFRADLINEEGTELLGSVPYDEFIDAVRDDAERFDAASVLVRVTF